MSNESGSVAAPLKRWNRQHTPDAANEHRPAVRASGLLEDAYMAYGAGDVFIENEAELLPVLGTKQVRLDTAGAKDASSSAGSRRSSAATYRPSAVPAS